MIKVVNYDDENRQKLVKVIEKNNKKRELFDNNIGKIVEIWNKYECKPLGEKTKEKINNEMSNATNLLCYVINGYYDTKICIHEKSKEGYACGIDIEIYLVNNSKFLIDNKVQKINVSDCFYYGETEIQNVNETCDKIMQLHKRAMEIDNELREIARETGTLTGGNLDIVNYGYYVKQYF